MAHKALRPHPRSAPLTPVEKLRSSQPWSLLRDQFYEDLDGIACLRQASALVDEAVCGIVNHESQRFPCPFALFAVGGFGRAELAPHSDVDLLFVHAADTPSSYLAAVAGPITQTLWDAGLEPSHSVHSLQDVTRFQTDNTEFSLSLLDARFLGGDSALAEGFWQSRATLVREKGNRLVERVFDLLDGRWRQFDFTIHHLEPDIKDGPGGLRDLHMLRWLAQLKKETPFWSEPGRWQEFEPEMLRHLAAIRCFLHFQEGRNQNTLRFDAQEEWLDLLARRGSDPAVWSRESYRRARTLQTELKHWIERYSHPVTALQRGVESWRARLSNADFLVSRGTVHLKAPLQIASQPALALDLFRFVARHGLPPSEETIRRLREALPSVRERLLAIIAIDPIAPADAATTTPAVASQTLAARLLDTFELPHANLAVRAMEASGYLAAIFPEWQDIDSLLVRDYYHRYTVDEHTLVCIDALCDLLRGRKDLDPRMLDLAEQIPSSGTLVLALIFHDIGKKDGVEGHAERSGVAAEAALHRLGFSGEIIRQVRLLVDQHLLLSYAMRTRDLADPATGTEITAIFDTLPMLRMLTALTYADIRGVFPGALTPWRMDQLWSAYRIAQLSLEDRIARERIRPEGHYSPAELRYLQGFSTRYTRLFLPAQVHDHFLLYQAAQQQQSGLRMRKVESSFELIAVCEDTPLRFADVTSVLAGHGLNILLADAFRNAHGVLLLRFRFDDPGRSLTLNPSDQERLIQRLELVLYEGTPAAEVLPRRSEPRRTRSQRRMEPYVHSRNEVSPTLTMFEIGAADRPGLLSDIARTIAEAGCTIDVLIVETRAHRAFDTLYVQMDGRELTAEEQQTVTQGLLDTLRANR
jgi:[protein-PII] uridylyltransferase